MGIGLLFINNSHQDMYLPIFHEDREFVSSILLEAMKKWEETDTKSHRRDSVLFYEIADNLGKERSCSHIFIGPEAASQVCLGGVEYACKNSLYIFSVDFKNKKIITLK